MMQRSIILLVMTLSLLGCDTKQPEACFELSETLTETDFRVDFSNCSEKAAFYRWDFGNGTSSDLEGASIRYREVGDYKAVLYAYSKNGYNVDSTSMDISIRNRYFDRLVVTKVPEVSNVGAPWDADGSGPDIRVRFRPIDQDTWWYETELFNDLLPDALPVTTDYSDENLLLSSTTLLFEMREFSGAFTTVMWQPSVKPKSETAPNPIVLSQNGYRMELWWELHF